jgi:hypothetical protein
MATELRDLTDAKKLVEKALALAKASPANLKDRQNLCKQAIAKIAKYETGLEEYVVNENRRVAKLRPDLKAAYEQAAQLKGVNGGDALDAALKAAVKRADDFEVKTPKRLSLEDAIEKIDNGASPGKENDLAVGLDHLTDAIRDCPVLLDSVNKNTDNMEKSVKEAQAKLGVVLKNVDELGKRIRGYLN